MWDRNQNIINIALFDFLFITGLTEVWQALYSAQLVSEFDNFKQRIIITLKASPQNERNIDVWKIQWKKIICCTYEINK